MALSVKTHFSKNHALFQLSASYFLKPIKNGSYFHGFKNSLPILCYENECNFGNQKKSNLKLKMNNGSPSSLQVHINFLPDSTQIKKHLFYG